MLVSFSYAKVVNTMYVIGGDGLGAVRFFCFSDIYVFLNNICTGCEGIQVVNAPRVRDAFRVIVSVVVNIVYNEFRCVGPYFSGNVSRFLKDNGEEVDTSDVIT